MILYFEASYFSKQLFLYDKTQKILPKEYIKTKKAERIENLKLPLKTKAMMKILNEPDFYKKSLLIKQFKKEGLLNE